MKLPMPQHHISATAVRWSIPMFLTPVIVLYVLIFCLPTHPRSHDVVVYGATPAAITAAIQTRRMGKSVAMVCPGSRIGGLTTSGLGWTDSKDGNAIGGVAREFYAAVYDYYESGSAWTQQTRRDYRAYAQPGPAIDYEKHVQWTFEPHVAEHILEEWLKKEHIPVYRNEPLIRSSEGVRIKDAKIVSIKTESGHVFKGSMFIDATYDGDLMATAGISYRVGRESQAEYGESLAGISISNETRYREIDPYMKEGDPESGLLEGIDRTVDEPDELNGDADPIRLQSYNYRVSLTRDPDLMVSFHKPKHYDEAAYEILLRYIESGYHGPFFTVEPMPNGKTDSNAVGEVSTDLMGGNYNETASTNYAEASYEEREIIAQKHKTYEQGFFWTLANHPRVPERLRNDTSQFGYAKDEWEDNAHWPRELYIRESRRMQGDHVMTQDDIQYSKPYHGDSIVSLGSYSLDIHAMRRVVVNGQIYDDGRVYIRNPRPYTIPYGAIIPKASDARNFLNPVTVSSTHVALSSMRMEPTYMILGQSAATAAVMALEQGVSVQDVDRDKLSERLKADKQVLSV